MRWTPPSSQNKGGPPWTAGVKPLTNREPAAACVLRLFGAPELQVRQAVEALSGKGQRTARYRTRGGECLIAVQADTPRGLEQCRKSLRSRFSADLYGEGQQGLAAATVQALENHRRLLVCADGTAGALLEARLENLPGAEKIFDFGTMSYADREMSSRILHAAAKHADAQDLCALGLARVQAAQRLIGAEFAVGCVRRQEQTLLVLGTRKGCWTRWAGEQEQPGLWLLDMVRRAACGLPQAEGSRWQHYRDPVAAPGTYAAPAKRCHWGRALLVLMLLAALLGAAGWYYTGGDLAALPGMLQSIRRADSIPRSGARLLQSCVPWNKT